MEDLRKDAKGTRSVSRSKESITVSQVGVVHSSINTWNSLTNQRLHSLSKDINDLKKRV